MITVITIASVCAYKQHTQKKIYNVLSRDDRLLNGPDIFLLLRFITRQPVCNAFLEIQLSALATAYA